MALNSSPKAAAWSVHVHVTSSSVRVWVDGVDLRIEPIQALDPSSVRARYSRAISPGKIAGSGTSCTSSGFGGTVSSGASLL